MRSQPEFIRLLDGVDHVAPAIGECHHLGARCLCLQQIRTEIRCVQGMPDAADDLASGRLHGTGGVGLQRMTESVVDGDEEPAVAPFRDGSIWPRLCRQRITVIDPGCFGRRAGLAGKGRAPDRAGNGNPVVLGGKLLDRERHGGIVETDRISTWPISNHWRAIAVPISDLF